VYLPHCAVSSVFPVKVAMREPSVPAPQGAGPPVLLLLLEDALDEDALGLPEPPQPPSPGEQPPAPLVCPVVAPPPPALLPTGEPPLPELDVTSPEAPPELVFIPPEMVLVPSRSTKSLSPPRSIEQLASAEPRARIRTRPTCCD
jgi:hypothetical protein